MIEMDHGMQRIPADKPDGKAFADAVRANPKDDQARLALADWLESVGEKGHARQQRLWARGRMDCITFIDPTTGELALYAAEGGAWPEDDLTTYMDKVAKKSLPPAVYASGQYWIVAKEDVPQDRTLHGARELTPDKKAVTFNLAKARNIRNDQVKHAARQLVRERFMEKEMAQALGDVGELAQINKDIADLAGIAKNGVQSRLDNLDVETLIEYVPQEMKSHVARIHGLALAGRITSEQGDVLDVLGKRAVAKWTA